jgi:membrane associated rhomboid family serine protease
MYALSNAGPIFEKMLGAKRYLTIFLISGVAGNLLMLIWFAVFSYHGTVIAIGASGAIFGLFGGLVVLFRHIGQDATSLIVNVGFILLLGFLMSGIAWQAHVGGLIGGAVATYLYTHPHRTYRG